MPLSKEQLLIAAREDAAALGAPEPTRRAVSKWIEDGLLEAATATGRRRGQNPAWSYPDRARDTVTQIVAYKALGAVRNSQIRLLLWLLGKDTPLKIIKGALRSEYGRFVRNNSRCLPWPYDRQALKKLSEHEHAKASRRIPPNDATLVDAGFSIPNDTAYAFLAAFYWGVEEQQGKVCDLSKGAENIDEVLPALFSLMGGALGDPEEIENSGEDTLKEITSDHLETARTLVLVCLLILLAGRFLFGLFGPNNKLAAAYEKAANSFLNPEWLVASLGLFSIMAYRIDQSAD